MSEQIPVLTPQVLRLRDCEFKCKVNQMLSKPQPSSVIEHRQIRVFSCLFFISSRRPVKAYAIHILLFEGPPQKIGMQV
jgi:hypothetical protein